MYHLAYIVGEDGSVEDGPDVATNTGWLEFGTYVLDRHDEYPELAHVCQEEWNTEDSIDAMAHEAEQIIRAGADPDVAGVAAQLLSALRARPQKLFGVRIDGGEEEDDEPGAGEEQTAES